MHAVLKGPLVMAGLTRSADSLAIEGDGDQGTPKGLPTSGACLDGLLDQLISDLCPERACCSLRLRLEQIFLSIFIEEKALRRPSIMVCLVTTAARCRTDQTSSQHAAQSPPHVRWYRY